MNGRLVWAIGVISLGVPWAEPNDHNHFGSSRGSYWVPKGTFPAFPLRAPAHPSCKGAWWVPWHRGGLQDRFSTLRLGRNVRPAARSNPLLWRFTPVENHRSLGCVGGSLPYAVRLKTLGPTPKLSTAREGGTSHANMSGPLLFHWIYSYPRGTK